MPVLMLGTRDRKLRCPRFPVENEVWEVFTGLRLIMLSRHSVPATCAAGMVIVSTWSWAAGTQLCHDILFWGAAPALAAMVRWVQALLHGSAHPCL